MHFGAGAEVLFGVCEEVVRAGAGEVGAADFGVREGEVCVAGGGAWAHILVWRVYISIWRGCGWGVRCTYRP